MMLEDKLVFSQSPEFVDDRQLIESGHQNAEAFYIDPFQIPDDYEIEESMKMTEQDCLDLYATVVTMYLEDRVVIDNAAERFLQRARDLQSTAAFHGLLKQAMAIEAEIHKMCGENHDIQAAQIKELANATHSEHDGHNHSKDNEHEIEHHKGCSTEKGKACDCKKIK
ncbi:MAG TPA: hypothetical protein PKD15_02875 [Candidatus Saccharibacteria bacterium]|nr:hypothetical protein [Candidatus Saccharibacteria bacterium]